MFLGFLWFFHSDFIFQVRNLFLGLMNTKYDWQFYAQSSLACKATIGGCIIPRGKILGGSTSMNDMLYVRGNRRDFDQWETDFGVPGWNYETVLKYFKRSEGNQIPALVQYANGRYHNATGPVKVDYFGEQNLYQKQVLKAAAENGYPIIDDINADKTIGFVPLQGTYFQGRRWSPAKGYLIPAKKRPNLHVIKHAFVTKILINEKNEAYGVKFNYKGKKLKAFSRKEVILSAGAIMSPVILMNSGIGPRNHLKKYNIPVKSDLPVGENLLDHITTWFFIKLNPTNGPHTNSLDSIYNLAIHNSGPLVISPQLGSFLHTMNNSIYPDVEQTYVFYERNSPNLRDLLEKFRFKKLFKVPIFETNQYHDIGLIKIRLLQPKTHGRVRLGGKSPFDKPIIDPKYFTEGDDMDVMLAGVKLQLALLETKALQESGADFIWIPIEECDRFPFRSDDYLRCYISYSTTTDHHFSGTSKMAPDSDKTAVVDPLLRVRNIRGLRQVDAGM